MGIKRQNCKLKKPWSGFITLIALSMLALYAPGLLGFTHSIKHYLLPYWPRSSVDRASEDLVRRSWIQTPPISNFLWLGGLPKFL